MLSNIDNNVMVAALLRGEGCAKSLKTLLQNREISSVSTEPLINTILDSFSLALSSSHNKAAQRSSKKKIDGAESLKNYRDDSPTPCTDDGFAWRKYGQKKINASVHQRCYYRCTYAKEQNCDATKRVQKIQDNPPVYRTTYVGQHVCKVQGFAVNDDTYGSDQMIQFNHVMPESVLPQLTSIDHHAITMEKKSIDHIMNQECDINNFWVDDGHIRANQFPPFSSEDLDLTFFDNIAAFDENPFQF